MRPLLSAWDEVKRMVADPDYALVLADELNIVLRYDYLPLDEVLSVFIYADEQDCVARVMKRNQLSEHEAAKRIKVVLVGEDLGL